MSRFSVGARVRAAKEKTTDRIGTVVEVLPRNPHYGDLDNYRVEFTDGTTEIVSDMELSPAGSGPTAPVEGAA